MPFELNRCSTLVRLIAICSALLLLTQIVARPAVAAPAHQGEELSVAPEAAEDEAAAADDEAAPTDEDAAASADDDAAAAEPEDAAAPADDDEPAAEPAQADDEAIADPADEDEAAERAAEDAAAEPAPEAEVAAEESAPVEEDAGPVEDEQAAPAVADAPDEVSATPVAYDDDVDDRYLRHLLDAINERRRQAGTQRLAYIPARANAALDPFLAETVPAIRWPGPCGHNLIDGAFSWDYISATGFDGAPRGEVIACPGPEPYWTPDRAAEQWWESPIHHDVLYADGESNSIACSAYGVNNGANGKKKNKPSEAASAVLCVTFRG